MSDLIHSLKQAARSLIKNVDSYIKIEETLPHQAADLIEQQQARIAELEAKLREAAKANHLSQLIGERNSFRRVSAMNVDGWLKQKMKSEIERVTCRIEETKKDKDHE